jgi:DNA-binding NtrC family response regulator
MHLQPQIEKTTERRIAMTIASILLVDDEIPFVEAMTKRLSRRGLEVEQAFSGDEALKKLANGSKAEVVILDVKMPGKDGIENLMAIKQQAPLVEVIMLTGHATVESAIEGMKRGAFDYLLKPCDMAHLITKVTEAAVKKRKHEEKIIDARIKEITARQA